MKKNKIIVILGTTASGKTGIGIKLAYDFNGEIVSADSRQVYRGMDIGTGKDLQDYRLKFPISSVTEGTKSLRLPPGNRSDLVPSTHFPSMEECKIKEIYIPYHLIDVVEPCDSFNVADFKARANEAINDVIRRGRLPIVVGGTGLYLQALADDYDIPKLEPDEKLRAELEKLDAADLYARLKKIDKHKSEILNKSDRMNPHRLIRAIELAGQKSKLKKIKDKKIINDREYLIIGMTWPREVLCERIHKRLIDRLEREAMVDEVDRLHKEGVSWQRLESFGLEYKWVSLYLQEKISYDEMVEELYKAIRSFSKRQMTWFRRWERMGRRIVWENDYGKIKDIVIRFLA